MNKLILPGLAVLMLACNTQSDEETTISDNTETSVIQPPLEGDFANDTTFRIDPKIDNHLETPNGSSIDIPANCLVDETGNPILEDVDICFSQYHSMADIISSGIPMAYDTMGQHFTFESAGMFKMTGFYQGEKKAFVLEGENIDVNLASDKDEKFNFYALNEKTGEWSYDRTSKPDANPQFDPSVFPLEPECASEDAFVLDLDLDNSKYSELSNFNGIVWEYTGDHDSLDPRKNKWTSATRWTDFELDPTGDKAFEYFLTMSDKSKKFVTRVKASLTGGDFDLALADFNEKKKEIANEMDNLQKPYIRSVEISGFGTYNYDYYHQMAEPQKMIADFDFGKYNSEKEHSLVVVLYPDKDVCINYTQPDWQQFAIDKASDAKILAIMPGNKVAVFRGDIRTSFGRDKFKFPLEVVSLNCDSKDKLNDILQTL